MPIEFRCQACQRLLHTPDYAAGGKARCPECGAAVPVPVASSPATMSVADPQPVETVARGNQVTDGHTGVLPATTPPSQTPTPPSVIPPAVLDPNAPALRETPSRHAADTDYPVRKPDSKAQQFETTLGPLAAASHAVEEAAGEVETALDAAVSEVENAGIDAVEAGISQDREDSVSTASVDESARSTELPETFDDLEPATETSVQPAGPDSVGPAKTASSEHQAESATTEIRVTEVLGTAWKTLLRSFFSSAAVGFVAKLIFAGGVVALVFGMIGLVELIDHGGDEDALMGSFGIVAIFAAFFLLFSWLYSGVCLFVSNISHGHPSSFLDLFRGSGHMYRMFAATIIFAVAVAFGLALFLVPGIYIFTRFCLFGFFIVDRNLGPVKALRASHRVTGDNLGKTMLALVSVAGVWFAITPLPLGVFVATPLAMWMLAVLYFRLCGDHPSVGSPPQAIQAA